MAVAVLISLACAVEIPKSLPDPAKTPPAADKPVQVYILSGQSNMVGMGTISGGNRRIKPKNFHVSAEPDAANGVRVSIYKGKYDPDANYDEMTSETTATLTFGGTKADPFPKIDGPSTAVARGALEVGEAGLYAFSPGYKCDTIMWLDGEEVQRDAPEAKHWAGASSVRLKAGKRYPFKVIYTGRNANGYFWQGRRDVPGTLTTLTRREGKFQHLVDEEGNWTTRNDVIYKGVVSAVAQGPLTVGIQGGTFGPELQFGHIMGYYHQAPVLLIKASIGNRSLAWDILPPGSTRYTYEGRVYAGYKDSPASWEEGTEPEPINWYAGKTYDRFVKEIHGVLNNFDTLFPQFKEQGYEIAGFVWWQGHKDGGSQAHALHYEQNLVNLIQSWRKEFNAPNAPWAIATVGFGGHDMSERYRIIWEAQMAVSDPKKHPELAGSVATVDIRDFWRSKQQSPSGQGYHYNRNAETYLLVGNGLGRAMVKLLNKQDR